jgi:hypothetical protein
MWGGAGSYKYVNTETINGVRAKHYTWKESAGTRAAGYTTTRGESWVAVDGGYIVRYAAEVAGQGALLSPKAAEGSATIEYNLTEANGRFDITQPKGCDAGASDIPILPDARDKLSMGEMIAYQSATPFADAVTFYREHMPKNGWTPGGAPSQGEDFAILEYRKDARTAQVSITLDGGNKTVSVVITVSKQ